MALGSAAVAAAMKESLLKLGYPVLDVHAVDGFTHRIQYIVVMGVGPDG